MSTRPADTASLYPASSASRDLFVVDRRPPRAVHDPWRYQDVVVEDERAADGRTVRTATVFLTGRECPWRCVMCDLWRYTTPTETPPGAIPAQVAAARERLRRERPAVAHLKLYNAGSFFDSRAVPEEDYEAVAAEVAEFARVTVESHPALVGARVDRFLQALDFHRPENGNAVQLEVAMGLETVHQEALERLHKRMTVEQFVEAANHLARRGVALRVFLLIAPPFVPPDQQESSLLESVDVAFGCGAAVVTLIPTRDGNGALEALSAEGSFRLPRLHEIEWSVDQAYARAAGRGRLFVDLWDLHRFSDCPACFPARRHRLDVMNLEQRIAPRITCEQCAC